MSEKFICIYCGELTENCKGHSATAQALIGDQGFRQRVLARLGEIEAKLDQILDILTRPPQVLYLPQTDELSCIQPTYQIIEKKDG